MTKEISKASSVVPNDTPTEREAEETLARAMAYGCDFVTIESKRDRWLYEAAEISVRMGHLYPGVLFEYVDQSAEMRYRPTPLGKLLGQRSRLPAGIYEWVLEEKR